MTSSIPTERDADGNAKKAMKPIILQHPGFENDIRLNVFGQEYHAHPIILKLNSAYFRKFLDSADKVPAVKRSLFSYDYVTVVDADGEWSLEAVKSVCRIPMLFSLFLFSNGTIERVRFCSLSRSIHDQVLPCLFNQNGTFDHVRTDQYRPSPTGTC